MIGTKSRLTAVLASAAALSFSATPALAQSWGWGGGGGGWGHHHRDRVDAGDVIAGILIIGGIAAIASAASKNKRDRRDDDRRYDNRPDYPRDRPAGYGNDNDQQWQQAGQQNGSVDSAVARCISEVSRGSNRGTSVESINRDGDGWRVQGQTSEGAEFSCSVDGAGRLRNVQVAGRAY